MLRESETRYARGPDGAYLAYQVFGSGDLDIVYHPGAATHAELIWDFPTIMRWPQRIASLGRVLTFDIRGSGVSDPLPSERSYTLDDVVSDVLAAMDAVGMERAAFIGELFVGPAFIRIAAELPDRVERLVLNGTYARYLRAPDHAFGMPTEMLDRAAAIVEAEWGSGYTLDLWVPSLAGSAVHRREWARYERGCGSPGRIALLARTWWAMDARADLQQVRVPTLVLHSVDDVIVPIEHARDLVRRIDGARFVERRGDRILLDEGLDELTDELAGFLLGPGAVSEHPSARVEAIVFVDIVDSTAHAARVGDHAWRRLLDEFRGVVRTEFQSVSGREVNTRGDDFLLLFDSPRAAITCARAVRDRARVLDLDVRAGVHLGEVQQLPDGDVTGLAVHIGARVAELARPGELLVSQTVRDVAIGAGLALEDRGAYELKGVPGEWRLFVVVD